METGIIKFYHASGYGFIVSDETGKDIFFHAKDVIDPPAKGERVCFDVEIHEKGLRAVNIKKYENGNL